MWQKEKQCIVIVPIKIFIYRNKPIAMFDYYTLWKDQNGRWRTIHLNSLWTKIAKAKNRELLRSREHICNL